jgi:hypothetical protein
MSFKDVAVKKYVVRLSAEEREYLDQLIRKGKSTAAYTQCLRCAGAPRLARLSQLEANWGRQGP